MLTSKYILPLASLLVIVLVGLFCVSPSGASDAAIADHVAVVPVEKADSVDAQSPIAAMMAENVVGRRGGGFQLRQPTSIAVP